MKRILIVIFWILVIITLGETAFYLYYHLNNLKGNTIKQEIVQNDLITNINTATPQKIITPVQMIDFKQEDAALDEKLLSGLLTSSKYIRRDLLKSYFVTVELEGEINKLELTPEDQKELNNVVFLLQLKGSNGSLHDLMLHKDTPTASSILKVTDDHKQFITIDKLKLGDKIRVRIEMELSKPEEGKSKDIWTITKIS